MAKTNNTLIYIILYLFLLFSIAIAFDFSPYLRGPGVYPPDWRWPYLFANTTTKLWFPLLVITALCFLFSRIISNCKTPPKYFLPLLVILSFIFQISVLYFSRAGVTVLIARIINPDMNGYFTTSLTVSNVYLFLHNYTSNVLHYPMHTQGHPPGGVLFFYIINKFFLLFPQLNNLVTHIQPSHPDIEMIWSTMQANEKTGAIFSALLIPFLSSVTVIPLYKTVKFLYNERTAVFSSMVYIFIPSIVLFSPLNDEFLPLITISSFYYFVLGIKKNIKLFVFISGLLFSFGLFFSVSILPLVLLFLIFFLLHVYKKIVNLSTFLLFIVGVLTIPLILYVFYGLNPITLQKTLLSGLPVGRKYSVWVFYNIYDFFIFSGIPVLIAFAVLTFNYVKKILLTKKVQVDILFISFFLMLLLLDLSGTVRGEVARIWIPFYPFLAIIVGNFFVNKLNFSKFQLLIVIVVTSLQVVLMQEFWVTLW